MQKAKPNRGIMTIDVLQDNSNLMQDLKVGGKNFSNYKQAPLNQQVSPPRKINHMHEPIQEDGLEYKETKQEADMKKILRRTHSVLHHY